MHNVCNYVYNGSYPHNYIVKQILINDGTSFSIPATIYGKEIEVLARNLYEKVCFRTQKW